MALIERTNVVIPDEYVTQIVSQAVQDSAAMRLCRRATMATGAQKIPVLSALPTAYWVSPRDTGRKGTSSAGWEDVTLTAEELAVIIPIPENVLDDATFDIEGEVRPLIAEAMAAKVDAAVLFGDDAPSSWPTDGIVGHAIAAGNVYHRGASSGDPWGGDLAEDINQTMALAEDDGFDVSGFVARRGLRATLRGLRDKNGSPIFSPQLTADSLGTLYGVPIAYTTLGWDADVADLVAGDFSKAVLGIRRDMTFKVLDQAVIQDSNGDIRYNLPQQDMVALRCVMRLGFALANPITRAQGTENVRSPFAVLAP